MLETDYNLTDPVSVAHRIARRTVLLGDCWRWTGATGRDGYGRIKIEGRNIAVHRAAWAAYRGTIPAGLVIDHLCRVRACVNPWHLDVVPMAVNTRRGHLKGRGGARTRTLRSACRAGHPYSDENTAISLSADGYIRRACRACNRKRLARWRAARA